jgi:carboxypeptidase family protein
MAMKFVGSVFLFVIGVCLTAGQLAAQETINYGTISGRVIDPQGAVVPGASVTARQTETNLTRETVTDEDGRFRFPYLRVGRYEIAIRMSGFSDATRAVTVTVGSAFELPVVSRDGPHPRGRWRRSVQPDQPSQRDHAKHDLRVRHLSGESGCVVRTGHSRGRSENGPTLPAIRVLIYFSVSMALVQMSISSGVIVPSGTSRASA